MPYINSNTKLRIGNVIALGLMLVTCISMLFSIAPQAQAQGPEILAAEKITKAVEGKDINYVIVFAGVLSTALSFYLVRSIMKMQKDQSSTVVTMHDKQIQVQLEHIKSLKDLTDEIRNRKH